MGIIANTFQTVRNVGSAIASGFRAQPRETTWQEDLLAEPEKMHTSVKMLKFLPYWDNLQNLGETQKERLAYRKMASDAYVKASLYTKIASVMSTEMKISPVNKKDARETLIADFCQWNLSERQNGGMPAFIWSILSGMAFDGFAVCEPVWEIEQDGGWSGKEVLDEIKAKDVDQDLIMETDEFNNWTNIKGLRFNAAKDFKPEDFIITSHLPIYGNKLGQSDLRAAYRPWWYLDTVTKIRGFAAEKRALPVIAGEYPDSTKQAAVNTALSKIKSSNWLSVPVGVKLQVLDIAGRGEDFFKSFRADCVEEIITSIAWASLQSVGGKEGQIRGDSQVHEDTSDISKWVFTEIIKHVLNNHKNGVIRRIVDRNFSGVMSWPKAAFGKKDPQALKEDLDLDKGLQDVGWVHSREDLTERYGRRWGMGDDALQRPQAAQQPGMAGRMDASGGRPMQFSEWVELPEELAEVFAGK